MKLCRRLYLIEIEFYSEKLKNQFLSHPLGHYEAYTLHLYLIGKPVVDFLFIIIEFVRYLLQLRCYKRKSVEVGVFRREWVTLRINFRLKGYFRANIYGPLDRGTTILQLCAGSFHTKKRCIRLYTIKIEFY